MENPAGAPVAPVPEGAQTWMFIDAWVLPAQLIVGVSIFVFLPAETGEVITNAAMAKAARAAVTVVLHLLLLIRHSSFGFLKVSVRCSHVSLQPSPRHSLGAQHWRAAKEASDGIATDGRNNEDHSETSLE